MAEAEPAVAVPAREREGRAIVAALRPRQWPKNLLVFAGILFAAEYDEPGKWAAAVAAFAAYCAASSAAYLFNDVLDAPEDRLHPLKQKRPVASGALSAERALGVAALLAVLAVAVLSWFGWASVAYVTGFLALQAVYSYRLKQVVLIDVMAIAALFVIRAAAGAEAVDVASHRG
jgi:decaprenyl-phosphate phosphoribosyltransferase